MNLSGHTPEPIGLHFQEIQLKPLRRLPWDRPRRRQTLEVSASPQEGRTVVFPDPADLAAAVDDQPLRSKEEEVCSFLQGSQRVDPGLLLFQILQELFLICMLRMSLALRFCFRPMYETLQIVLSGAED